MYLSNNLQFASNFKLFYSHAHSYILPQATQVRPLSVSNFYSPILVSSLIVIHSIRWPVALLRAEGRQALRGRRIDRNESDLPHERDRLFKWLEYRILSLLSRQSGRVRERFQSNRLDSQRDRRRSVWDRKIESTQVWDGHRLFGVVGRITRSYRLVTPL